jgi:hypothetical protein
MRILLVGAALGAMFLALVSAAALAVAERRSLATLGPVLALAADGDRAAVVVGGRRGCASVVVWDPSRTVTQLQSEARCVVQGASLREGTQAIALAGTRAAWLRTAGGNMLETWMRTATLARRAPLDIAMAAAVDDSGYGWYVRGPVGDGNLIAFTIERRCDAYNPDPGPDPTKCPPGRKHGSVLEAMVMRIGGGRSCPNPIARVPVRCSRVAKEAGELTVLAVDAGRIVVRTDTGIRLLTGSGAVLGELDATARSAALSGKRLALRKATTIDVHDTGSGSLLQQVPAAGRVRLEDLRGDLLVTASGGTVTVRRLRDGRTTTFRPGGVARAQLEQPGLFVAGGRRVTFTPMRVLLRRLGT